jgi:hypothetical protein
MISRAEWMHSLEAEGFDASIEMEKLAAVQLCFNFLL